MNEELSKLVTDARELLGYLRNQSETNQMQIDAYKDVVREQKELMEKRIIIVEKQWSIFRSVVMVVFTLIIIPMVIGGFTIKSDVDAIKARDYAEKTEVLRSFGIVIDQTSDVFDDLDYNKSQEYKSDSKSGVSESFGYVSRSAKTEK